MCGRILKNTHFGWIFPLWMWNCFLNNLILCLCNVRLRSVRPLIKMVVSIVSRTEVCAVKFFEDLGWQTMSAKFTQAKILIKSKYSPIYNSFIWYKFSILKLQVYVALNVHFVYCSIMKSVNLIASSISNIIRWNAGLLGRPSRCLMVQSLFDRLGIKQWVDGLALVHFKGLINS